MPKLEKNLTAEQRTLVQVEKKARTAAVAMFAIGGGLTALAAKAAEIDGATGTSIAAAELPKLQALAAKAAEAHLALTERLVNVHAQVEAAAASAGATFASGGDKDWSTILDGLRRASGL